MEQSSKVSVSVSLIRVPISMQTTVSKCEGKLVEALHFIYTSISCIHLPDNDCNMTDINIVLQKQS